MTALSGGDRRGDAASPMSSVLERSEAAGRGPRVEPRPLDRIFPLLADAARGAQMRETWLAFAEMMPAVGAAIDTSRSPPEIAYAIGEIVHNFFRTRGVTLTSFELRRLVAELLDGRYRAPSSPLVTFGREPPSDVPSDVPWAGDETPPQAPVLPDAIFGALPSPLVRVAPRSVQDIAASVLTRLGLAPGVRPAREAAAAAIAAVLAEDGVTGDDHSRLALEVLSELCGLGLIDRLWADRTVRAVFVHAPDAVWIERDGRVERAPEAFRDQTHLLDLVGRLAIRPASAVASFRLRDGSEGTAIFPPAAPAGPVLVLRRGEAGQATFERLIAAGVVDRAIADLLRMAARGRLGIAIVGPEGSGKTSLLAAIVRDAVSSRRVVSVARHRAFRWQAAGKVELVVPPGDSFGRLATAALQLRPDLLVVDPVDGGDLSTAAALAGRQGSGAVVAVPASLVASSAASLAATLAVDVIVRLGRAGDGLFRVASVEDAAGAQLFAFRDGGFRRTGNVPAFAAALQQAGYGDALASVLG